MIAQTAIADNEALLTIAACGEPKSDTIRPAAVAGGELRTLVYRDGTFRFDHPEPGWRFATYRKGEFIAIDRGVAARRMPCFGKVHLRQEPNLPAAKPSNALVIVPANTSEDVSFAGVFFAVFLVIAAPIIAALVYSGRRWNNRPSRLCTNCYEITQPFRHGKKGRWYCPFCQADNPVQMDSPIARAYLARQQTASLTSSVSHSPKP